MDDKPLTIKFEAETGLPDFEHLAWVGVEGEEPMGMIHISPKLTKKLYERNLRVTSPPPPIERMTINIGPNGGLYFQEGVVIDMTSSPKGFDNGKWKVVDVRHGAATIERITE